jgi:hypothetical protein
MDSIQLIKAIKFLKPTAEFVMKESDYNTIEWHILEGDAPTQAEIDAAIEIIKQEEAQAQEESQAKREAALAKLAALGLEPDDLKALGL